MEEQEPVTFRFKGIPFSYSPLDSTFHCDAKTMLYVLSAYFPTTCSDVTRLDPKLEALVADLKADKEAIPESDRHYLDSEWRISREKDAGPPPETNVTEEEEKTFAKEESPIKETQRQNRKSGMISQISKGIKRIIAKITPKKLHKRLYLTEDQQTF
eukprot:TRINITY_DN122101_c0_g1_i1.p2 TRINITY_DN122101_c0_g1~~TRINITY_DN122101_c0_g1_i1.p2  ORF type:complete len:157 (-),score=15.95 TRINITY_DN122101_c0_g1_i1:73-543(-)